MNAVEGLVVRAGHMQARQTWGQGAVLCVLLAGWLAAWPPAARAESLGRIMLPDGIPDMRGPVAPVAELADPPPLPGVWGGPGHRPLGVNLDNYQLTIEQINAAKGTGCGLVRLSIPMEAFLEDNDSDWATLDQVVSRLKRSGFEVLPVLDAASVVPDFYLTFCTKVAQRYKGSFNYYQILDNVNYKHGIDSRAYSDISARARLAIRLADPEALLVSGGIRGVDLTYLDMLELQNGIRNFDVLAFNMFPGKNAIEGISVVRQEHSLPYMEDAVAWAAERGKKVWVTSFGVSCDLGWVGVDQPTQGAEYARGALFLGWLGVEHVFISAVQDSDESYQAPARCCGLLDVWGEPKPAYYALQQLNNTLAGAYQVEPIFFYRATTHQQPNAADYQVYASHAFEAGDALSSTPLVDNLLGAGDQVLEIGALLDGGPMGQLRVRGLPMYAFWFYAPEQQEYRLVSWMSEAQPYPVLMTLYCGHQRLAPFGEYVTPTDTYSLLDEYSLAAKPRYASNMLFLPLLPVDTMPSVVRFKLNTEKLQQYLKYGDNKQIVIDTDPQGLRPIFNTTATAGNSGGQ
jgi:hypothetical protein